MQRMPKSNSSDTARQDFRVWIQSEAAARSGVRRTGVVRRRASKRPTKECAKDGSSGPVVFVAVSGGVDSAVSLALLKRQGYDVVGCFMQNWSRRIPGLTCNWVGDREDAMRVCANVGVPFRTVNLEKTYRDKVFKDFIAEYKRGNTPNPDVLCNSEVKFKAFLLWALRGGADAVATGHYAYLKKVKSEKEKVKSQMAEPKNLAPFTFKLFTAADVAKDQTYFLYRLGQKELARTIFPVGGYTKTRVRALARKFALPVAEKKDSQGLCFVGEVALQEFLKNWIPEKPGKILRLPNRPPKKHSNILKNVGMFLDADFMRTLHVVGKHRGVWFYTIGQRHGLGLPGGSREPLYVAAKDLKRNMLFVASRNHPALHVKTLLLKDVHWVLGTPPESPLRCRARIRYRQPLQQCTVTNLHTRSLKGKMRVVFRDPQWAPAPGQSVVFYDGSAVLGGGIIV